MYRQHHAWLLRTIRSRFGPDQAEDLVQEVYLRAASYAGDRIRNPRALLAQIATRAAIDRSRRAHVREHFAVPSSDAAAYADQAEALALKQIILALPEKFREIFVLSRFAGLTNDEIAEQRGISVKTVEWRMTKALKLCAKRLRD